MKLAPDLAEAHRTLAVGLHISLRLDEAPRSTNARSNSIRGSKVSRGSLADLYRASGKTEEALALYNEQLAADPKDSAARAGKVISLFELYRKEEANSALEPRLPRSHAIFRCSPAPPTGSRRTTTREGFRAGPQAIAIEPRYTWAQIALSSVPSRFEAAARRRARDALRAAVRKVSDAELRARKRLASMGLYDEAVEVLRESFTIKADQIQTNLAGHLLASEASFLELLAPERRAGIYQPTSADSAANAKHMKALLAFNLPSRLRESEKIDESLAVAAAQEFAIRY